MFNIFWFTHHLFILYFGLNCIHGIDVNKMMNALILFTSGAAGLLEPPTFWIWFIGPGLIYTIERTMRLLRGNQDTILLLAVAHPSKYVLKIYSNECKITI
jgi:hypothetical protein